MKLAYGTSNGCIIQTTIDGVQKNKIEPPASMPPVKGFNSF